MKEQYENQQKEENGFDDLLNIPVAGFDQRTADFVAESKENRTRCYEYLEAMSKEVAEDGDMYRKFLDIQSRFDRYTSNNTLLIMAQRPDAKQLGDYGYWREQNVYIRRAEKYNPIFILEPGKDYQREDGSTGTYYNAKKLYDISQTTMKERDEPETTLDERLLIRALIYNPPVSLETVGPEEMPPGEYALFSPEDACIYICKGMEAPDIFRCVSKELAHAEMARGQQYYDKEEHEFHAYSASYLLCKKYGIDVSSYQFEEAPDFFEGAEPQEIRGELYKIREAANGINARMAKVLEPARTSRETSHER